VFSWLGDTYLFALDILPALPFIESRAPVLKDVCLGVLLALTLAKAALGPDRGYHVRLQQVDLQILLEGVRHHVFGTPSSSIIIVFQSETEGETLIISLRLR